MPTPIHTTDEDLSRVIQSALKLVHIKTTPEISHAPVTIAYACEDLGIKDSRTIKAMAKRGELEFRDGKITWESLHAYKLIHRV